MNEFLPVPGDFDIPADRLLARREHLMKEIARPRTTLLRGIAVGGRRDVARPPHRSGGRKALAVAVAVGLLAAAVAGAASGLLPVGEVIPLSKEPQSDGLRYTSDRTVVATGATPVAGRWRMTVADSDHGFCFGIELLDQVPPGARGPDLSEGCGGVSRSFDAASVGGGSDLPDTTLVYGPVPEEAATVRVTAPGGFSRIAETHDGPGEIPGDFYVVEIPRKGLRNALVNWLDEQGRRHGPGIFVPSTITYRPNEGPKLPH